MLYDIIILESSVFLYNMWSCDYDYDMYDYYMTVITSYYNFFFFWFNNLLHGMCRQTVVATS